MATQTPAQNQESWSEFARPRRFIPVAEPEKVSSTTLPSNPKINDLWVDPQGVRWRYISSSGFNRWQYISSSDPPRLGIAIASQEELELVVAQRRIAELERENATLRSENVALKIELSIRKSFHTDLEIEIQAAEAEMLWLNNLSSRAKKSP